MQSFSRQRLLVLELWGLGDLALAVPFLREACLHARVTLVAKPQWSPIVETFCPEVELAPFVAPWTAFAGKYRLPAWPWRGLASLLRRLRRQRFDLGVSARPDPRDHVLLRLAGARRRLGFPRAGSGLLLSEPVSDGRDLHRADAWRKLGAAAGWTVSVPAAESRLRPAAAGAPIVVHSGAGQPTRVWPLERFGEIVRRLRGAGRAVRILCDPGQTQAWRQFEELAVAPENPGALLDAVADASQFLGNDSGPGHVAALCGVPTFTIFGPQIPRLFAPTHPQAAWIDGRPCPFKPCFDACRFARPHCIEGISADEVWAALSGRLPVA